MNRWFIVLLAAAALSTAGCNQKQESSTTEVESETAVVPDTEVAATGQTPPAQTPLAADNAPAPDASATPAATGLGAEVTLPGGTKYIDTQVGTGQEAVRGSTVSVHYTGTLTDGTKFDSSLDSGQPYEVTIGTTPVIKGWTEGLVGMKVGGHRSLTIPPDQAYGPGGKGPIPPDATLLFDIEMLDVN